MQDRTTVCREAAWCLEQQFSARPVQRFEERIADLSMSSHLALGLSLVYLAYALQPPRDFWGMVPVD